MNEIRRYIAVVEAAGSDAGTHTVYHGSPNSGIAKLDLAFAGSNTGDKDARHGLFFFGRRRSAEGYLERFDNLKPEAKARYDKLEAEERKHEQAYHARVTDFLRQRGITEMPDFTSWSWEYKLPSEVRWDLSDTLGRDADRELAEQYGKAKRAIHDRSENLQTELYGAVYECRITLRTPYEADLGHAAYTADRFAELINYARREHDADGMILHNVYDSEVGIGDTVYVVFDHDAVEIMDKEVYDGRVVRHRSY